jgi:hypothetical protein
MQAIATDSYYPHQMDIAEPIRSWMVFLAPLLAAKEMVASHSHGGTYIKDDLEPSHVVSKPVGTLTMYIIISTVFFKSIVLL